MVGGPAAALYGITDSGWMDAANFLSWFVKLFLPAVLPMTGTAPVAQFLDGHHSHISLEQQYRALMMILQYHKTLSMISL